jgi:N-acetylmuramoyl-L-alanine amidase
MRTRLLLSITAVAAAALAAPASAHVPHVVQAGETLWSIAANQNLTTRALAAANGLSPDAHVVLGSSIRIPTVAEATAAIQSGGVGPGSGAPPAMGAYVVRPGDSLLGIASRAGVAMERIAWMNGLDPKQPLLIGTVLKLPTGASIPAAPAPGGPRVFPNAAPYPTPVRLSGIQVGQIAATSGAPAALAKAIAWQESGFNNAMVSSANARGVMQVMPGTWDYVQRNLASLPLDPASAHDNVRAGSLFLAQLLRNTGWNVRRAIAGYYQGLSSVRRSGMFPSTRRYVDDVMALWRRFGG